MDNLNPVYTVRKLSNDKIGIHIILFRDVYCYKIRPKLYF